MEFFTEFLVEDPKTGYLISTPSNSPEIGGLVAGPTMDHQIIRALFNACIEAAEILNTDQAFAAELKQLVKQQRYPQSPLRNLAGNGFLREVADEHRRLGIPLDEQSFKKSYFDKWLVRDSKSGKRPSASSPEHLKLYLYLLENLAVKVLREGRVDDYGFFALHDDDMIDCQYQGQRLSFPAIRILDRSGLKHHDPRTPGDGRYRFEPIWLHRMLVDAYNRRISSTTTSARGQ